MQQSSMLPHTTRLLAIVLEVCHEDSGVDDNVILMLCFDRLQSIGNNNRSINQSVQGLACSSSVPNRCDQSQVEST
jgi:hypothetical protein